VITMARPRLRLLAALLTAASITTARGAPPDPWQDVPARAFVGEPASEAGWFVERVLALPAVVGARDAWTRAARAIDDEAEAYARGLELPPVERTVVAHGLMDRNEIQAESVGGASLQDVILRALYGVIERRARAEVLRFVLDRVASELCARDAVAPYLEAACRLARADDAARLDLQALRTALRKDLVDLPTRLATRAALAPPLGCALRLFERVQRRVGSIDALSSVVAILDEGLRLPPCSLALPDASAPTSPLTLALRSARLLAAVAATRDTTSAHLVASARDAVTRALDQSAPAVLNPGLDRLGASVDAIASYLRDRDALDRPRWERALAQARATLDAKRADLRRALDAALATQRREGLRLLDDAPLARLAAPVLAARWREADDDATTVRGARAVVHGAAALLGELLAAGRVDPDTAALVAVGATFVDLTLGGSFTAALDHALASPALAGVEPLATLGPWIGLVAGLADASTRAEAEAVLDRWAAPVGTWEARRDARVFGISAAFGVGVASEDLVDVGGPAAVALGLTVPVGVDLSFPLGADFALGVMAQLLDLGAIGTARLGGRGAEIEPRVGLVQVLAPGLRLYLGLGRSPFVLTTQVDFVPSLRTRVDDGATERGATVMRFGLGLAVDVPLVTVD